MVITAELSLYPLNENFVPPIKFYIEALNRVPGLEVRTNALSTELYGEYDVVMDAVQQATKTAFEKTGSMVLMAKYLNKDRRQSL